MGNFMIQTFKEFKIYLLYAECLFKVLETYLRTLTQIKF